MTRDNPACNSETFIRKRLREFYDSTERSNIVCAALYIEEEFDIVLSDEEIAPILEDEDMAVALIRSRISSITRGT
jgi:hypothetical protein